MSVIDLGARRLADAGGAGTPADEEVVDVLIVEDNLYDMELTSHALREHSVRDRIKETRDGDEALDFLFCRGNYAARDPKQQPRLILLDLHLPGMGGLEVLRQIRANPLTESIPVVILTQFKEDANIIDGYRLGANSFLVKRHDFDEFMKAVDTLGNYWLAMNRPPVRRAG